MTEKEIRRHIEKNWRVLNVQITRENLGNYRVRIDLTRDFCVAVKVRIDDSDSVWKRMIDVVIQNHAYEYFKRNETFAHVYPVCDNCGHVLKGLKYGPNQEFCPIPLDGVVPKPMVPPQQINPTHCPNCNKKIAAIIAKQVIPIGTEFSYQED